MTLAQVKQSKGVFVSNQGDTWRLLAGNGEAIVYFPMGNFIFTIEEAASFIDFNIRIFEQTKEKFELVFKK